MSGSLNKWMRQEIYENGRHVIILSLVVKMS